MKHRSISALAASLVATAVAALAFAGAAVAAPTPPFTQCVPVGLDTSCETLIVVNPDGSLSSYSDPTQGPYDGIDDTLLGIENNSSKTVTSIKLSGPNIFGFDGDGICAEGLYSPAPPACPYGPTGYEGPKTSFEAANESEGNVLFTEGGLAPGESTYFSLEENIPALECHETECEVVEPPPPCTMAKGVGHLEQRGSEGINEDNSLNVEGKPHLFELHKTGLKVHLQKLESSTCEAIEGGFDFRGEGPARVNKTSGDVRFEISTKEGSIYITVVVEKESVVVLSITNQKLNKGSHEHIS
jgi:hypothetical protein